MKLRRLILIVIGMFGYLRAGNSQVNDIVRYADGSLLTVGFASNMENRTTDYALARYLSDGSLDTSFNPSGTLPGTLQLDFVEATHQEDAPVLTPPDEGLTSVALTSDNKIIGAGFSAVGLNSSVAILKLNEDGSPDQTFNASGELGQTPGVAIINISEFPGITNIATGITFDLAADVAIDSQGRIIVVGTSDNGQNLSIFVLRLTPNGELDQTFNEQSTTPGLFTFSLENADLTRDDISASAVALTSDDAILVGGTIIDRETSAVDVSTNFIIVKVTSTGVLDTTFNAENRPPGAAGYVIRDFESFDNEAYDLVIDNQERIVIGGFASRFSFGGESTVGGVQTLFALARYNADGTIDDTFNANGLEQGTPGTVLTSISGNTDSIRGLAITTDNKVVATGFSNDGENQSFATVRYLDDGTLDQTFNTEGLNGPKPGIVVTTIIPLQGQLGDDGISTINQAQKVVIGENNQVYISGYSFDGLQNNFTTINYLANGDLDTSFNPLGLVSLSPGIVITPFGESLTSLGNGVPIFVTEDLRGVNPRIIELLEFPPEPIVPHITSDVSEIFATSRPILSGRATPNAAIALYVNDQKSPIATTTANKNGFWEVTLPSLIDGSYQIAAVSFDPLTGVTLSSERVTVGILASAPNAPSIESPQIDEVMSMIDPVISGQADPDTFVTIFIDDREFAQVATEQGRWSVKIEQLSEGAHTIFAQAQTPSGTLSPVSQVVPFSIKIEEQVPRITAPKSGELSDTSVTITGEGMPNSTVKLFVNKDEIAEIPVDEAGHWSYTMNNLSGSYDIYAASAQSGAASETITIWTPGKEAVSAQTEQIARIPRQTGRLQGRASPGARVEFYVGTQRVGVTTADSQGSWGYTPTDDLRLKGEYPVRVVVPGPQGQKSVLERRVIF